MGLTNKLTVSDIERIQEKVSIKETHTHNMHMQEFWILGLTEDASFDDVMTELLKHRKDKTKKKN